MRRKTAFTVLGTLFRIRTVIGGERQVGSARRQGRWRLICSHESSRGQNESRFAGHVSVPGWKLLTWWDAVRSMKRGRAVTSSRLFGNSNKLRGRPLRHSAKQPARIQPCAAHCSCNRYLIWRYERLCDQILRVILARVCSRSLRDSRTTG